LFNSKLNDRKLGFKLAFKIGFGLKTFFEVVVLGKAVLVLVLTLDGLMDLKNCGLKTKKVLKAECIAFQCRS